MSVRVLLIALMVALLMAIKPKYRRPALGTAGVIVLLVVWQVFRAMRGDEPVAAETPAMPPVTTAPSAAELLKDQVSLQDMALTGNGAPFHLRGQITNQASVAIRSVKLRITRMSCPGEQVSDAGCRTVWQGDDEIRQTIQPGASIEFAENIYTHTPVSRSTTGLRDTFVVIRVEPRQQP